MGHLVSQWNTNTDIHTTSLPDTRPKQEPNKRFTIVSVWKMKKMCLEECGSLLKSAQEGEKRSTKGIAARILFVLSWMSREGGGTLP